MWFRPLAALICLSSIVLGQDDLPGPGEPAYTYTDGGFTEPRGSQSTYRMGATMNVSWHTTFETSNLWLIVGWEFNSPIQLASNLGQNWYQWEVSTDSTNSSEIYAFRVVNATGTEEEQQSGGFLSAAFWIDGLQTTSSVISSTASHISTSASAPITSATTAAAALQTTESPSEPQPGLSEGGKIGVGVGIGVGALGIIALIAGIWFYRRSRNSKTQAADSMEPYSPQAFHPAPQAYMGAGGTQPYSEYYKPAGRGAELDAGQGYGFTPEAYSDNAQRAELQG
ncbi:uncharacterized protein F4822DRAFT_404895 [Hypoxylon trugodes]|uniref:uncharacterized protein n=1 Tax=Hypoxylon trugodes TaxID=326681 RepID=UPI00219F35B3|nr:uncharacterized protein F4822DRAFT_404895 [Hypoxylon trugodes]KAI1389082.1 hypothetical protein F4822DRAFT_404895 [Hypoxylon trugodes]